ncbi:VacJ family lipoprotein [Candidatus Halocynthiibacter alkanivorans]|uniref:MlaA family lipoprotein n=1 Tax=Candidatus Halocynthiibacter alkanivorans TaxID=2267619 RepID=UPI000DF222FC|nr:VacJ family lipoprotein [Candidatus Halocynthiibacter alkanivorans]
MAHKFRTKIRMAALIGLLFVSACARPEVSRGTYDPFEVQNRGIHEDNRKLDQYVLRPVSQGYGKILPPELRLGVSNMASNLSVPGVVVNDLLQFNLRNAGHNTVRFLLNSTIGLGGLLDPAAAKFPLRRNDFGQTLYVWGAGEGAYLELPLLGPSTTRAAAGIVVDLALDPLRLFAPTDVATASTIASAADVANSRYTYSDTVDSILYDSEDSYAQSRLLYLENRRFLLGDTTSGEDVYDIYEDLYE